MKVAVVAHADKRLDGGLPELRRVLEAEGIEDPLWYEVPKAKRAPEQVRRALDEGADLIFAWGGDGTVRRCVGELAGEQAALAVIPAGTANLFATNLGIPEDIGRAVDIGLRGARRRLDVGRFEDERFAVMAGVGFDAAMIRGADDLKARIGRAAYLWSGTRSLREEAFEAEIAVDGTEWFEGRATCILLGNVGELFGGVGVFPDARPDDGRLELGVATAEGVVQWARTLARTVAGDPARSPFVRATKAEAVKVKLNRKVRYELDGGDRTKIKAFEVAVEPGALRALRPAAPRRGGVTWESASTRRAPVRKAEAQGERVARRPEFEWLARAGLVARGAVYGIIGLLAVKLALGDGGKTADQQGALHTIAGQPFGKVLLILMAIGLAGYALWRLVRAAIGHGPESGEDDAKDRAGGVVSGLAYGALCVTAIQILAGAGGGGGPASNPDKTTGGVLDWPGGQVLIGLVGVVIVGVGFEQAYQGIKRKFLEKSKTEQMGERTRQAFTGVGVFGHLARAVVFVLIGYFLVRAAIDYNPDEAIGLDGALAKLGDSSYGPVLLGVVAVGLLGFALYSVLDARYRKV